jgi:hypothetical protein
MKGLIKKLLREGYADVVEIERLSTDIILWFANFNYPLINRLNRYHFIDVESNFYIKGMVINKANIDINQYFKLKEFILSGLFSLNFDDIGKGKGKFVNGKIIIDYNVKDFVFYLNNQIERANKDNKSGEISKDDSIKSLNHAMELAFKKVIVHELQHAFDHFKSNGKFTSDKKSNDYYDNKKEDPNRYLKYLNLPHEYWARFTDTVINLNFHQSFNLFFGSFKLYFLGWRFLPPNSKKILSKAAYKYWDIKRETISDEVLQILNLDKNLNQLDG